MRLEREALCPSPLPGQAAGASGGGPASEPSFISTKLCGLGVMARNL